MSESLHTDKLNIRINITDTVEETIDNALDNFYQDPIQLVNGERKMQ